MWDCTSQDCISRSLGFSLRGSIYVSECSCPALLLLPVPLGTSCAQLCLHSVTLPREASRQNFQAVFVLRARKSRKLD